MLVVSCSRQHSNVRIAVLRNQFERWLNTTHQMTRPAHAVHGRSAKLPTTSAVSRTSGAKYLSSRSSTSRWILAAICVVGEAAKQNKGSQITKQQTPWF
jgi:hypothetical protein